MKVRLIEPAPPVMHMWSYTAYPRLGLPMIGAALKAAGHDVRIYAPKTAPIDWDDVNGADVVGLSTTTSTAPAAYDMADGLRLRGIPVVMGGSHVTFLADEALAAGVSPGVANSLREANTALHALALLAEDPARPALLRALCRRAAENARNFAQCELDTRAILFDFDGTVLADSLEDVQ